MKGINVGFKRNKDREDLLQGKCHHPLPEFNTITTAEPEVDSDGFHSFGRVNSSHHTIDPYDDAETRVGTRSALGLMSKQRQIQHSVKLAEEAGLNKIFIAK